MALDDVTIPASPSEIAEKQADAHNGSSDQHMQSSIDNIVAEVAALHQTVKERLTYDHVKEEAFDRLYVEVEEARQERSFQQVRPLLMDLILLYDRIELGIQQLNGLEGNRAGIAQLLKSFRDEVLEILFRREVEVIITASPTFDRSLQQAIKIQPTTFANEHNQVVRVVRRGFRYRNRILRSEEVIVSSYKVS